MKAVRVCFLLLLAVLLPVRGAVAATMLCAVGSTGMQTELRVGHHPAGHETMDHATDHALDHTPATSHDHAATGHPDDAGPGQAASDKCTMCSAYCSLTPLASTGPTLAEPQGLAAVKLSDHPASPPSFLSDGQERPPRTI